jgi:hypothetical protein
VACYSGGKGHQWVARVKVCTTAATLKIECAIVVGPNYIVNCARIELIGNSKHNIVVPLDLAIGEHVPFFYHLCYQPVRPNNW